MGDEFLALEKFVNLNYMVCWHIACCYCGTSLISCPGPVATGVPQDSEEARQVPAACTLPPVLRRALAPAALGAGVACCAVPGDLQRAGHTVAPALSWPLQGNYSDLLVALSNVHSKLRGDTAGQKNEDSAQACCLPAVYQHGLRAFSDLCMRCAGLHPLHYQVLGAQRGRLHREAPPPATPTCVSV